MLETIPQVLFVGTYGSPKVVFIINRNGSLQGCGIAKTSGSQEFDLALKSRLESVVFEPLPKEYKSLTLKLLFEVPMQARPFNDEERRLRQVRIDREFAERDFQEKKRAYRIQKPWEFIAPYQGYFSGLDIMINR